MPAYTVAQLQEILGTGEYSYVVPRGNFISALKQVLPRIMALGLWRDMTYEISLSGELGYVSLPPDTDSVLACTINDRPRPVRSLWHDVRITGRHPVLSQYYGIVDAGYFPVLLDMKDAQGVESEDDVTPIGSIYIVPTGTTDTNWATEPDGEVVLTTNVEGRSGSQVISSVWSGDWELAVESEGFTRIESIVYNDITQPLDLLDALSNSVLATIPTGSGVLRFRRFRTSLKNAETTVHLLVKRSCPSEITDDTIIYLGNIGAIKHGLLGLIAEDNADIERAEYHWTKVGKLLDEELLSILGAAKPTLVFNDPGAWPIHNYM